MIHRLHKGFCSYNPLVSQQDVGHFPEHIQTRKELDFFTGRFDSSCWGMDSDNKKYCNKDDLNILLRCPNDVLSKRMEERISSGEGSDVVVDHCRQWLLKNNISE